MPDPAFPKPETNAQFNKRLCESKVAVAVRERLSGEMQPVRKLSTSEVSAWRSDSRVTEAVKAAVDNLYEAKIGQADKKNQNERIYPRGVWQDQIDRLHGDMLKNGYMCGAVDHLGQLDGGNLRDTCIIHRDIRMDEGGAVWSKFQVVKEHSRGKDLQANIDAGMAIGFSTYGFGAAKGATDEDRKRYGLAEDEDAVVMQPGFILSKCDAVDDPSVADARICMENANDQSISERASSRAEACSTGLHWKEIGMCGHILGECHCAAESKHHVYVDRKCEKCVTDPSEYGVSVAEFKAAMKESKCKRTPVKEGREPLAKTFAQYIQHGKDTFTPAGPITLSPELSHDAFDIVPSWDGVRFVRHVTQSDELYHFAGSATEAVLKEIDDFWNVKEDYKKYGVLYHRGVLMHGPPGMGKTGAVNQTVEMVTARGDVVFYGRNVATLMEGLTAFRDVEPDRKVVVVLEDADEYIGYQERDMLNLLDGANAIEGVLYLATTNYLSRFPERMTRSGRFDKKVFVGPPPLAGRESYLTHKLGKVETAEEIKDLATKTDGLSFADLRELITSVYALKQEKNDVLDRLKARVKSPSARPEKQKSEATLTASLVQSIVAESKQTPESTLETAMDIKNLDDLKKNLPEVYAAHIAAVEASANKAVADKVNPLLESIASVPGVKLPLRDVLPQEVKAQHVALESKVAALESEKSASAAKVATLESELAELKAKAENRERASRVGAKAQPILADNSYADSLLEALGEKLKADSKFDEADVEAFLDSMCVKFDKISGKTSKGKKAEGATAPRGATTATEIDDDDLSALEDAANGKNIPVPSTSSALTEGVPAKKK